MIAPGPVAAPEEPKDHAKGKRTDFIVVFFWREYAPSDQYLKTEEPPAIPPVRSTLGPMPKPGPSLPDPSSDSAGNMRKGLTD
jgi:hypothetical protein